MKLNRRQFLRMSAAGAGLFLAAPPLTAETRNGMPYRVLGKTGEKVSLLCLGGSHIGGKNLTDAESIAMMRLAADAGINFFDNAHAYHGGRSEVLMGKALKDGYRDKVFLMTKNKGRDAASAQEQLEESLRRLDVDVIDLLQVHEVVRPENPRQVYDNGVLEVLMKARDAGKVRYIGVTGHNYPQFLNEMLAGGFDWDTIQMPLNVCDAHYRSFQHETLPKALELNLGIIAMKTQGGSPGAIPASGEITPEECLRYAMSLPVSSVCSGMDTRETLEANIRTAKAFVPLTDSEKAELLARSRPFSETGTREAYKTIWHRDVMEQMEGGAQTKEDA
jgi:uncharacterized protein